MVFHQELSFLLNFFIDYQPEKFHLQLKHMQEFDQPKNEKPEFLALPPWSAEMKSVLQIIQNSFPIDRPRFEHVDSRDANRAKIQIHLNEANELVLSCLGKNELTNSLVFRIFIATKGADFQVHRFNKNVQIPMNDDGSPQEGILFTRMGAILDNLVQDFFRKEENLQK